MGKTVRFSPIHALFRKRRRNPWFTNGPAIPRGSVGGYTDPQGTLQKQHQRQHSHQSSSLVPEHFVNFPIHRTTAHASGRTFLDPFELPQSETENDGGQSLQSFHTTVSSPSVLHQQRRGFWTPATADSSNLPPPPPDGVRTLMMSGPPLSPDPNTEPHSHPASVETGFQGPPPPPPPPQTVATLLPSHSHSNSNPPTHGNHQFVHAVSTMLHGAGHATRVGTHLGLTAMHLTASAIAATWHGLSYANSLYLHGLQRGAHADAAASAPEHQQPSFIPVVDSQTGEMVDSVPTSGIHPHLNPIPQPSSWSTQYVEDVSMFPPPPVYNEPSITFAPGQVERPTTRNEQFHRAMAQATQRTHERVQRENPQRASLAPVSQRSTPRVLVAPGPTQRPSRNVQFSSATLTKANLSVAQDFYGGTAGWKGNGVHSASHAGTSRLGSEWGTMRQGPPSAYAATVAPAHQRGRHGVHGTGEHHQHRRDKQR